MIIESSHTSHIIAIASIAHVMPDPGPSNHDAARSPHPQKLLHARTMLFFSCLLLLLTLPTLVRSLASRAVVAANVTGRRLAACGLPTSGVASVTADCSLAGQIAVAGTLAITGRPDLTLITQTSGRHFALAAGDQLHLWRVKLQGGEVSTRSCSSPDATRGGGTIQAQGLNTLINLTWSHVNGCGNQACAYYGGGILAYDRVHVLITDSTISGNTAVSASVVTLERGVCLLSDPSPAWLCCCGAWLRWFLFCCCECMRTWRLLGVGGVGWNGSM